MVHIILLSSVILAIICSKINRSVQIYPFAVLFMFSAFRYMYGNDYASYMGWHTYMKAGGNSPYDEFLFTLLNRIFPNFYLLVAVTSLAYIYVIYRLIKDTLPIDYYWIGVLIFVINPYLFLMNLSSIRQCLAMLMFIIAVRFAIKRKPLPFLLFIGLAVLFHKSAVFLLPVYFVCGSKSFKRRWTVVILICLFAVLSLDNFQTFISNIISLFNDKDYNYFAQQSMQNSLRATLLTGLFFIYVLLNLPKMEGKALVYSKLYLIGTILGVLAMKMSMLTRFQMYFDIFSIVAIPLILEQTIKKGAIVVNQNNVLITVWDCINKYVMPFLLLLVYVLRYYSFFTNAMWSSFAQYHTIFEVI